MGYNRDNLLPLEFVQVTLGLVPKVLNPVDMTLFICEAFKMACPEVLEVGNIQYVLTSPTIRMESAWFEP